MAKLPYQIAAIVEQMGGMGLRGAFCYVGGHRPVYAVRPDQSRPDPSSVTEHGLVSYQTGLMFQVNGKRNYNWKMIVSYEPDDTYTVRLWQRATPSQARAGKVGTILAEHTNVYCDNLKDIIEDTYDNAIREHCEGFIPL